MSKGEWITWTDPLTGRRRRKKVKKVTQLKAKKAPKQKIAGAKKAKGQAGGGAQPSGRGIEDPEVQTRSTRRPAGLGLWAQDVTGAEDRDDRKRGDTRRKRLDATRPATLNTVNPAYAKYAEQE